MDLMMSGVKVPRLGSVQDITLRAFMRKKANQELTHSRLLAQVAMGVGGSGNKSWSRSITNTWNAYVRAMTYTTSEIEEIEKDLQEEYKLIAHLRPTVEIAKDGSLTLHGIPKD